jgi:(R)-2-hydroxyacyl-CoA dehydratese activating ATPase
MISVGLDVGSRTIKMVVMKSDQILTHKVISNTLSPIEDCRSLLLEQTYHQLTVTGYGRHLLAAHFPGTIISEILATALGCRFWFPSSRTILDIGGQDTKAIALHKNGRLSRFELNDKCAAGTGRFLEMMALAMGYSLEEFSRQALQASAAETINSMCAVFAESEVVSLLNQGADKAHTAAGVHQSVVKRSLALLQRIGITEDIVFCGGVALNLCAVNMLQQALHLPVQTGNHPQTTAALGCALHGCRAHLLGRESE